MSPDAQVRTCRARPHALRDSVLLLISMSTVPDVQGVNKIITCIQVECVFTAMSPGSVAVQLDEPPVWC